MSEQQDTVKVIGAFVGPTATGSRLSLITLEGPQVHFDLDDGAIAMLSLTTNGAVQAAKARYENKTLVMFGKDEQK
jgi:hypothetical protein